MSIVKPDPLMGPKLKVERAKRHLADLETTLHAFHDSNPYGLVEEIDLQTGEYVYRVRIHKSIPCETGTIIGDIIHNLRSALDQMVCGLVRANSKQVSGGNGFPIMGSAKSFEEACVRKLKNVPLKAQRFIQRLKPYQGGNTLLWQISELDNMDKHNAIVPVNAGQIAIRAAWSAP
ncbi:MAG: hypothetical protein WDN46_13890 [Methylocella sp.]